MPGCGSKRIEINNAIDRVQRDHIQFRDLKKKTKSTKNRRFARLAVKIIIK